MVWEIAKGAEEQMEHHRNTNNSPRRQKARLLPSQLLFCLTHRKSCTIYTGAASDL